jgi:hypothetical protein
VEDVYLTNTYTNSLGEQILLSDEELETLIRNKPDSCVLDIPDEITDKHYFGSEE